MMDMAFQTEVGRQLRSVRLQAGLSRAKVEAASGGRWKAVVIGSYERGARAMAAADLLELAAFYCVPPSMLLPAEQASLLPAEQASASCSAPVLRFDLPRLAALHTAEAAPLARFLASICAQRGDYNGRVLTVRRSDLTALAMIYQRTPQALVDTFITWQVLPDLDYF